MIEQSILYITGFFKLLLI